MKYSFQDLPKSGKVVRVHQLRLSNWCDTTRYDVELPDGTLESFFEKRAFGENGADLIQAHWHSESSIFKFIPEFTPRPIASGAYRSNPDAHYILMEFEDMDNETVPGPEEYMAAPAALQLRSLGQSPAGKFGFPVATLFGHLKHSNSWQSSWQVWWTNHMKFILEREEEIRGQHTEQNTRLVDDYMSKVLPRYLGPLESGGRSIQPALCHTDLWPGNVKFKTDSGSAVVFDANALWAHSEVELGIIRNPTSQLGDAFIEAYLKKVPISKPREDFDSRIIMYMIRHEVCRASIYPDDPTLRDV
ncbi:Fructosamine kinase-domain-containing protein [Parachaetomium inaequale]|uniref:protein-ribulosamine 3-kinase n=1 Tax=Parachaetomium inaequale TaxID=2588326 RepID=A0AAN6SMS9_9PEZI|nr:Fructosamine kinase-domain-containing protein [Parachaetomium inaequale]